MAIPSEAKLVFKGVIFDVYQWQQRMFDGSYQTFERIKRPDTVQVIAVLDGKIHICLDEQPDRPLKHSLLGGRVDAGEDPLTAAKRELLEESGLCSDDWELLLSYAPHMKMEWTVHYYIARNCRKIAEPHLDGGGERITLMSLTFEEFLLYVTAPSFNVAEFSLELLRMQADPIALETFRKRLFRNS
jgi:ADP-ribose pyrophosphatase